VEVLDLGERCKRVALRGLKPSSSSEPELLHVVPCTLAESLSFELYGAQFTASSTTYSHISSDRLQNALSALSDPPAIFLAINSEDSSIVYYKISSGIVKPVL
jgi:tRNA-splicing endonuclease subunit Sen15, fungi type